MHLLVLTDQAGGGKSILPALEYLDHTLEDTPLDATAGSGFAACDVVVIDATETLRDAAAACRAAAVHELRRPILVVVGEGGLAALKATWGFDDWMLPDASPAEVETRLRLIQDRVAAGRADRAASIGDLVVNEESYQVRLRGEPLDLTYKEFELLKTLANNPNRAFTRDVLLQEVWGYDYFGGSRTVDVHIRRLRAKLGPEYESMIVTVRGVGYKLVPPHQGQGSDEDEEDAAGGGDAG